jgi:hypothetical protein
MRRNDGKDAVYFGTYHTIQEERIVHMLFLYILLKGILISDSENWL